METPHKIKVNGKEVRWPHNVIFYDDVVSFTKNPNYAVLYSMTYSRGTLTDREGFLFPGKSVQVVDGMQFNAYVTSNG